MLMVICCFVVSNSKHPMDSWILDSAHLFRMTSNKDWFDTYRSVNSGIVNMANGAYFKIAGIGNIRIKMFDGMIRTLCDVRHVPEIEKNLISLGILNSNGHGYKSEGGVMKVTKGAIVVIRRQKVQRIFINCWEVQL